MSNIDQSMLTTASALADKLKHEARLSTVIPKSSFCIALADLDIITDDECVSSAKGEWPDGFKGFLAYLSAPQARNARTLWAAASEIHRMDGTILALAWWFDITDETLDQMFGITA